MKNLKKTFVPFLLLVIFSFTVNSQEYKPKIKVSKGENYNYSSEILMEMNISAGGQDIKMNSSTNYTSKNKIDNINSDGTIEIINTTSDIKIKTQAMGKDSTITMDGNAGPTYKQKFDKLGNFISKTIIDSSQMNLNLENNSGNMAVFCEFPDKNLKPGDKWTKDRLDTIEVKQIGGAMDVKAQSEYTMGQKEKIDGMDLIKVTYTSTLTIGGKGEMMGMNIFMEGTGAGNGELYFNPATGVINMSKGNVEMDINMVLTGAQNMNMPMNQKITLNQKLIK